MLAIASGSQAVERAAAILRAGGVVAFPTETVYGLGADTFNDEALRHVYELKGRPSSNPLIAHVMDAEQARSVAAGWDGRCEALAAQYWPGPLTIVVTKSEHVPSRATGGYPTIAVRSPAHDVARDLLRTFGGPISAPSANRSGHISPTRAEHVAEEFASVDDLLILDGGPCAVGIESTVVEFADSEARILRPGSISAREIAAVIQQSVDIAAVQSQSASPGTSPAHYAPRTLAELATREAIVAGCSRRRSVVLAVGAIDLPEDQPIIRMPEQPRAYAAALYDALRRADSVDRDVILIERPEAEGELWDAIRNRLERAVSCSRLHR